MKIKIYRTDSHDYYKARLKEYEKDPASMAFDFIMDNVVVNTLDHYHKESKASSSSCIAILIICLP